VVHELDPIALEPAERAGQIIDDVADMVERRPGVLGDKSRHSGLASGRLYELDPLLGVTEEDHADALVGDLADPLGRKAERVAEERKSVFDARDGDRDMMKRAELHSRGAT
jgi:hypothetical protein